MKLQLQGTMNQPLVMCTRSLMFFNVLVIPVAKEIIDNDSNRLFSKILVAKLVNKISPYINHDQLSIKCQNGSNKSFPDSKWLV